jgi:hypothetical protein
MATLVTIEKKISKHYVNVVTLTKLVKIAIGQLLVARAANILGKWALT